MLSDIVARVSSEESIPLSGLQMWLKADTGVTLDGNGRVSQWNDLSGVGRHVSQATAGKRPLFIPLAQGGRPGIQFVASRQDVLESLTATGITDSSVFIVMKVDAFSGIQDSFVSIGQIGGSNTCRWLWRNNAGGSNGMRFLNWNAAYFTPTLEYTTTEYNVYGWTQSGSSVTLLKNSSSDTGTAGSGGTTAAAYWAIGGADESLYGDHWTSSTICEVIIYNRAVSADERTTVLSYLKSRWATP